MSKTLSSRRDLLIAAIAVIAASALIEGLQHYLMSRSSMELYHVVSAALTVLLVAVAVWQRDVRVRWLEAHARAEALNESNAELRLALKELSRSDQLAAAGAAAAALSEQLRKALTAAEADMLSVPHREGLELILEQLQELTWTSRRSMRPVDVAALTQWVATEVASKTAAGVYCLAPDHPVWVKANPARLEMAVRHFIAHSAGPDSKEPLVIVVDAREECATVAVAGAKDGLVGGPKPETLNWEIARAVVSECGGSLAVTDEPGGVVYTIYLPLGPVPQNVEPDLSLSDLQEELRELETVAKQDLGRSPTPDAQSSRSREGGLATKRGAC